MWKEWNSKKNNFDKNKRTKSILVYGVPSKQIPDVSIIIPTFRRARLLKEALDSALNQKGFGGRYEIIVVDNDGDVTPDTDSLMNEYTQKYKNVMYYRNETNIGLYGNWNRCIELCRTDWFCMLHDDDLLVENYLSTVFPHIKTESDLGLLGVYASILDNRQEDKVQARIHDSELENLFIRLRDGKPIPLTIYDNIKRIHLLSVAILVNKQKAIELGGIDDRYYPGDAVFYAKVAYYYRSLFLPERLCYYRIASNDSLSADTCVKNVRTIYQMTKAMVESVYHGKKNRLLPIINAVLQEESNDKFNPNVDYNMLWEELGISRIYDNRIVRLLITVYYKLSWAMLFFRPEK